MTATLDRYAAFVESMDFYRRTPIPPRCFPATWERLWQDIGRAYAREQLSDNEFDDLMNRYAKEVQS